MKPLPGRPFLRIFWRVILGLFLVFFFLPPQGASAHPADMYAQEQSLELAPGGLTARWRITPGPLLARTIWNEADQDADGAVSQGEAENWGRLTLQKFEVRFDGQTASPPQLKSITWPDQVTALETGDEPIQFEFTASWPAAASGVHEIAIHNTFSEATSLHMFSLKSEGGVTFSTPAQSSGLLEFTLFFSQPGAAGQPGALSAWESGRPNLPGLTSRLADLAVSLSSQPSAAPAATPFNDPKGALASLVRAEKFSPLFLLSAFLISLALGSLHALTPGHGKALVAAYLVGSRGRTRDAVFLGSIVTLTHTGSVLLLGLLMLVASRYIVPSLAIPILEIASGLLIVIFGASLLVPRGRALIKKITSRRKQQSAAQTALKKGKKAARSSQFSAAPAKPSKHSAVRTAGHAHPQPDGISHAHAHPHEHDHDHGHEHEHGHSHALPGQQITWKSLLTLGISGGLVPCPDAIAILLVAVAVNRIPLGMMLIFAFSLGLALVLIVIGIAMVSGARFLSRSKWMDGFSMYSPALSALIVLALGIALTLTSLNTIVQANSGATVSQASLLPNPGSSSEQPGQAMRLLYLAKDANFHIQLFVKPLAGGTPLQLSEGGANITGLSISSDRQTIAYATSGKDGDSAIWIVDPQGKNRRLLLECPGFTCGGATWVPGEARLVYERQADTPGLGQPIYSLWWLDSRTGETQPLFQDQRFPGLSPQFSYDGQWLSYMTTSNNTLQLYQLKDNANRSLPNKSMRPNLWGTQDHSLLYWELQRGSAQTTFDLKRFDLANNQTISLFASDQWSNNQAAWSPDGEWIAVTRGFTAPENNQYSEQIWLVKPDGSAPRMLLDRPGETYWEIGWTPDSRSLLYSSFAPRGGNRENEVWLLDIETGHRQMLLSGATQPILLP